MDKNYDDVITFIQSQVDKLGKDFERSFEEIFENATKYHSDRCVAPEDKKEECLTNFLQMFSEAMLYSIREKEQEEEDKKVKAFGYIIRSTQRVRRF